MLHVPEEEAIKGLQQKDWDSAYECVGTVQDIRLEMVWLVSMEGKDPTQHLVNMVRQVKAAVRLFGARSDRSKYGEAGLALSFIDPAINEMVRDMEREGMIDAAIAVYEFRIKDEGVSIGDCDRLRILYSKQMRYDEAIRVCRAFVDDAQGKTGKWDRTDPRWVKKFSDWIPKLEVKQRKLAQSMESSKAEEPAA
jgi:hypothetical protein